jgi:hypothetical protein
VYERFERNTFGANDHYIRFDRGGSQKVALKKLRPQDWAVLSEEGALRLRAAGRAAAATQCLTWAHTLGHPRLLAFTHELAALSCSGRGRAVRARCFACRRRCHPSLLSV